jgi:hypothetical protein
VDGSFEKFDGNLSPNQQALIDDRPRRKYICNGKQLYMFAKLGVVTNNS